MSKAARAIIIENNKVLVMYRNKYGSEYFTLVGGRVNDDESIEQGLEREIFEETGLSIIRSQLVYTEEHPAPYNEQYIYLCEVAPHGEISVQDYSEEALLNKLDANIHTPMWVDMNHFGRLAFRTPQLQEAITKAFKQGFPVEPIKL
jgi:ADP-ribose pyrophosphatase YjhB (NUDIX family)